jgi:hypothetical protein
MIGAVRAAAIMPRTTNTVRGDRKVADGRTVARW